MSKHQKSKHQKSKHQNIETSKHQKIKTSKNQNIKTSKHPKNPKISKLLASSGSVTFGHISLCLHQMKQTVSISQACCAGLI
ncbi:MAG: hypothetical protein KBT04_00085 [Bacteroidales bacterium]|nr:hypothetical protein [Candidatus Colimorpha onthohippi]